jgi:aminoglycoside phosphotransferase (APT) family kinase protein
LRVSELVSIARACGVPAPRYEDIVGLPDGGAVVLQEFVEGQRPVPSRQSIALLLDLAERSRAALQGTTHATQPTPLYLTDDGPGYCLHAPLRSHSHQTRHLLHWIEEVGRSDFDALAGDDLVHFDYHPGNMLAHPHDPTRIVAILDWDSASNGDIAIDAVTLALDLVLYETDPMLVDQIVDHLHQTTPESVLRPCWAHCMLRLVDWRIRHSPSDDLAWLPRAQTLANV